MPRFTKARSFGRDQEEEAGREELREMINDRDTTAGELLACLFEHCPPDEREDLHAALRELTEDRRGPRSWARDRLELRHHVRDAQRHGRDRRMGRDFGEENMTEPASARPIEEFRPEGDRRTAMDSSRMAFDRGTSYSSFAKRFPGAARIRQW